MAKHRVDYRKIWEDACGPIPKDEHGRSYEIHHIDGNCNNNKLENLKCLSAQEHYELHKKQGEYGAARAIAERLKVSYEELCEIRKKASEQRKGRPGKPVSQETRKKMSLAKKGKARGKQEIIKCPICGKSGGAQGMRRYHFDNCGKPSPKKGKAHLKKKGTNSLKGVPKTEEFRKALQKPKQVVTCPHCGLAGGLPTMMRHHFANCKQLTT